MATGDHFWFPNITFDLIFCHFGSIQNFLCFHKNAASSHFGDPKIISDYIFRHFRSICIFYLLEFISQYGRHRLFWITKNHLLSHISPFHINMQRLFYFFTQKKSASDHFARKSLDCMYHPFKNSLPIAYIVHINLLSTFQLGHTINKLISQHNLILI